MSTSLPGLQPQTVQYQEMRKAFYAGAAGMFAMQLTITQKCGGKETMRKFTELKQECSVFLNNACHRQN